MTGSLKIPVLIVPPWKGTSLGKETFTETSFIETPSFSPADNPHIFFIRGKRERGKVTLAPF
jgi:hypothetical protein